jgi:Protein of unknown function (DUF3800)
MLTAFFDDSGTHDDSTFVLLGGLYGAEEEWSAFDQAWRQKLAAPLPDKPALKRFHMFDCQHGEGEFIRYSKPERDALIHDMRNIIISSGVHGYCCGVSRVDWDDLVAGDMRRFLGDAERFCVTQCFVWINAWGEDHGYKEVSYVLDNRPHRSAANKRVFEFFQRSHETTKERPVNESISFVSSIDNAPLQAADLVAWEYYQFGKEWVLTREGLKKRPHLQRLSEARIMDVQFAGRDEIQRMVAYHHKHNPIIRQIGDVLEVGLSALPPFMR